MNPRIRQRVEESALYMVEHNSTIRAVAKEFGVSKTTTFNDLKKRLPLINPDLAKEVDRVIETNIQERAMRGGMATRAKFKNIS